MESVEAELVKAKMKSFNFMYSDVFYVSVEILGTKHMKFLSSCPKAIQALIAIRNIRRDTVEDATEYYHEMFLTDGKEVDFPELKP